jgi:lysophospholipase L1-like esterase
VAGKLGALSANLNTILSRLKTAAPGVPIIAINYYNPYLAAWLQGTAGEAIAIASTNLVALSNTVLENIYLANAIPVADVASAFAIYDFAPEGNLPHNVKTLCQLTWNCEYDNIHPNDNGYKVIAKTVEQLMKSLGIL